MKIPGPGETGKVGLPFKPKKDGVKEGQGFEKILAGEKGEIEGVKNQKIGQTPQTKGPQFPSEIAMSPVEAAGKIGGMTDQKKAILLTEQVLARLDFLKSALENPNVSLPKFSPLIETLEADGKNLEEISSKTLSDPKLKSIAGETATLVATEVMKFNRGDYGDV